MLECFFSIHGIILNNFRIQQSIYVENNILAECNAGCSCTTKTWDPVCGDNGLAYMSACFAGCEKSVGTGVGMVNVFLCPGLKFCRVLHQHFLCTEPAPVEK